MPAAYYELSVEQGSDFVSAFRILNPSTGTLFKFLPNNTTFWTTNNQTCNIDIPEEIKLAYPNINDALGWLKNSTLTGNPPATQYPVLQIACSVKNSSGAVVGGLTGSKVYATTASRSVIPQASTGSLNFEIVSNNSSYNMLLKINNTTTGQSALTGRYLYDIELTYYLGPLGAVEGTTPFVIRLLQGKMTFNPNITTG